MRRTAFSASPSSAWRWRGWSHAAWASTRVGEGLRCQRRPVESLAEGSVTVAQANVAETQVNVAETQGNVAEARANVAEANDNSAEAREYSDWKRCGLNNRSVWILLSRYFKQLLLTSKNGSFAVCQSLFRILKEALLQPKRGTFGVQKSLFRKTGQFFLYIDKTVSKIAVLVCKVSVI